MIVNPIVPIWLMVVICIVLVILTVYDKQKRENKLKESNNKKGYEISATNQLHATKHTKSEKRITKDCPLVYMHPVLSGLPLHLPLP